MQVLGEQTPIDDLLLIPKRAALLTLSHKNTVVHAWQAVDGSLLWQKPIADLASSSGGLLVLSDATSDANSKVAVFSLNRVEVRDFSFLLSELTVGRKPNSTELQFLFEIWYLILRRCFLESKRAKLITAKSYKALLLFNALLLGNKSFFFCCAAVCHSQRRLCHIFL